MERVDRLRARIAYLRDAHAVQKAERLTPADLDWFTSMNGISPEEALARHAAASEARCKQIEVVIAQLERELAELTAPKTILQCKPRKK